MKYSATMDDELLRKVDEYANDEFTTRSGLISKACYAYINSKEVTRAVKDMSNGLVRLSEKGILDDNDLADLKSLSRLLKKAFE